MNQNNDIDLEDCQNMFDSLSSFGNKYLDKLPEDVIEVLDYLANYCGDIAKGRDYTPDKPEDAFPTLFAAQRAEADRLARIDELENISEKYFVLKDYKGEDAISLARINGRISDLTKEQQ